MKSRKPKNEPITISLVLDGDVLERLSAHVEKTRARQPGITYTRSDAIREGIHAFLDKSEAETARG